MEKAYGIVNKGGDKEKKTGGEKSERNVWGECKRS